MTTSSPHTPQSLLDHHLEWNDRLQDWLDGDSSENSAEFEHHLRTCEICQQQLERLEALESSLMSELPRPRLDASFDARLFGQIERLDETRRAAARERAEAERQQSLDALARSWRRTLAFVL